MERGLSTLLAALVLILTVSSCLGQNDTARNETFMLKDDKDNTKICLKMTAAIVVNITYFTNETKNNNVSLVLPLTNDAQVDYENSTCDMGAAKASLYVAPTPGSDVFDRPYYILFRFTGSTEKGDQHWAWGNISFGVDPVILEDYEGANDFQEFTTDAALHGDPNSKIEFERSYICNSNQSISFPKANNISAFIYVTQLQVQAFKFQNQTSGEFDNARTCLLDSSGKANKIVPIAVGAALAGLVVVVLIAYLIGRLRSRRQSSYEALS